MKPTGQLATLALLALMQSPIAIAETPQVIDFQIPPQNLSSALLQFSENSGIKTFFKADIARNIESKGLSGKYTPQQALDKLLENTGVNYRFTKTESVTLSANRSELSTEMLLAQAPKSDYPADVIADDAYDGPVEQEDLTVSGRELSGYSVINANTATKMDMAIMDTPVSVQVVPRAVMDDQKATRITDVLENVSGVRPQSSLGTSTGFIIRGFRNPSVYRDGLLGGCPRTNILLS